MFLENRPIALIWCAATACAFVLGGCGGKTKTPEASGNQAVIDATKRRFANTENGLELRRWTVVNDGDRMRRALNKSASGEAIDAATQARLQRNGFRVVRIPDDQVDQLLIDLGGANVDSNEWHGQVHDWRALTDRPLDAGGRAVAVDGRVSRLDHGSLRLLVRSWTVQMEDGPRIHMEMVPQHYRPQARNLKRLLEGTQEKERIAGFGSAALDVQMEPGFAYVLVGDSPQADWTRVAADTVGGSPLPSRLAQAPKVGPNESMAAEQAAPLTLGEMLLPAERKPPTRTIMVFVPRIAPSLLVNEQQSAPQVRAVEDGAGG